MSYPNALLRIPQISKATLSPDLLSTLSWFSISHHPMLQTVYCTATLCDVTFSLPIMLWFWMLMSPQSSSTDRFVQSHMLSFPAQELNFNQHHRREWQRGVFTPSCWISIDHWLKLLWRVWISFLLLGSSSSCLGWFSKSLSVSLCHSSQRE